MKAVLKLYALIPTRLNFTRLVINTGINNESTHELTIHSPYVLWSIYHYLATRPRVKTGSKTPLSDFWRRKGLFCSLVISTSELILIASKWAPVTFLDSISAEFTLFVSSSAHRLCSFCSSAQRLFAPIKPLRNSAGRNRNGSQKPKSQNISYRLRTFATGSPVENSYRFARAQK